MVNSYRCIVCADFHLSHTAPVARSLEESWYKAQARPLKQLRKLQKEHQLPILCAGDIFHKPNPPPELINFALEQLPIMYAIPGNHDLPMHSYQDIKKSAYWTLVKGGKLVDIVPNSPKGISDFRVHAFPCGFEPALLKQAYGLTQEFALVHKYLWIKGKGYHGAPESSRVINCAKQFEGYDVVISGDNHIPFTIFKNNTRFINCGSLMRRNIDQIDYKPVVWLLDDKNVPEPFYLDIEDDVFLEPDDLKKVKVGGKSMVKFLEDLRDVQGNTLSFEDAVTRYLKKEKVKPEVKNIILAAMES